MIKSQGSLLSLACAAGAVAAVMFGGAVPTVFAAAMLTPLGFLGAGHDAAPSRFHTRWPTGFWRRHHRRSLSRQACYS